MRRKLRYSLAAVLVLLCLAATAAADPSPEVLTGVTTGRTAITNQDIPGAKRKAVDQALTQAVQNAFATLVSSQVFASSLEFLYDRLLANASEFVVTYRVLNEMEYKGSYLVGVESRIDLARVRQRLEDAKVLRPGQDKPVVLLLIAEQMPGDLLPKYWWGNNPQPYASLAEPILRAALGKDQIPVAGAGHPDPGFYTIQFQEIYDSRAAMDLGHALKADMVVLGKASAGESSNRMGNERTFEAVVDLTVFDLASEKEAVRLNARATASSENTEEGANQSLTQAAGKAAEDLGAGISSFWSQTLRKESHFDVAVAGDNQFLARFIALKQRFNEIRDVVNVQPKEIGSANAVMEIQYRGSTRQFADALLLKTFDGFGIEISGVTDDLMNIRFVEKQASLPGAAVPAEGTGGAIQNPAQ